MMTPREKESLLREINAAFVADRERLSALEEQMEATLERLEKLEGAKATAKKAA